MLDNIIDKNIIFLQNHGVKIGSDYDDKAIYKYGLQILYYYLIDLSVIFSLAYILGKLYETIIMVFIFGVLQTFGGGYHARTPLKCLALMIVGVFAGNILIRYILNYKIFVLISSIILSAFIFISGIIENENHPINKKVLKMSKIIVRLTVLLIFGATMLLLNVNNKNEASILVTTLYLYAIALTTAKIQKWKYKRKNLRCFRNLLS